MTATEALITFVNRVLIPGKSRRYSELVATKKGKRKFMDELCHVFHHAIYDKAKQKGSYSSVLELPCYVYESRTGFGIEFNRVREALDLLSLTDGWLIVLADASAGIYRPEARWDDEIFLR